MIQNYPTTFNVVETESNRKKLGIASVGTMYSGNSQIDDFGLIKLNDSEVSFTYVSDDLEHKLEGYGFTCMDTPFLFPVKFSKSHRLYFYIGLKDKINENTGDGILSVYVSLENITIEANTNNYIYVKVSPTAIKNVFDDAYTSSTRFSIQEFEIPSELVEIKTQY